MNCLLALLTVTLFAGEALCIKPSWQELSQEEGRVLRITWNINGNETLHDCRVVYNNMKTVITITTRGLVIDNDDMTIVYGTNLTVIIPSFNGSLHAGHYTMSVNTTNGVERFNYRPAFELSVKTEGDKEREMMLEKEEEPEEFELSIVSILAIVVVCLVLCIVTLVALIWYRKYHMAEEVIETKRKV